MAALLKFTGPGSQSEDLQNESQAAADEATKVQKAKDAGLAAAYHFLRKAIAVIAVGLPLVLPAGHAILTEIFDKGDPFPASISGYYYTRMGNVFVGALIALGVFFLSYQRRPIGVADTFRVDRRLCTAACVAAIGVAVFPTREASACDRHISWLLGNPCGDNVVMYLHLASAASLFVLLGIVALVCFTKSDGATPQKLRRNKIYRACAYGIFASVLALLIRAGVEALTELPTGPARLVFFLEASCVWLFGASWVVKAEIIKPLNDPEV